MEMNTDDKELHALADALEVEILPGTEIMKDVGRHKFIRADTNKSTVLVPQPTQDPHDPLNWSRFWKMSAIIASTWVTFTQGFGPLSLAPMFPAYIEAFHTTLPGAVQFTGVAILVLGFSNFFWVPLSTTFGRRPVYIFSQVINIGSAIWRSQAQTYGSFMGACVLNGFAAGPAETLQPAVIADIFFLHDRGKWNTLYWVAYMGSLMVAPIISGPMSFHTSWRNFWWLYTGMLILSLLMVVFLFPETMYHRSHPGDNIVAVDNAIPSKMETKGALYNDNGKDPELSGTTSPDNGPRDPYLGKGRPSRAQWRIFTLENVRGNPVKTLFTAFITPWVLFAFPIVEFAAFVVSWSCSVFLTLNLTQSQAFAVPPYSFSPQNIGFTNFAILIGAFFGLATAGPLSDWVSMRATIRNNGIREPEMRLPAMIPYVLIMILGNVVVAVGYQNAWPWEAIVIIGYVCAGIQVAALPSIASTYAVDSYKPVAGSLFVTITVNKNVWGYGFSKFITNWIIEDGYIPPIMLNMSLVTLWCLFGFLFYFYGKTFRRWTRNSKVHTM